MGYLIVCTNGTQSFPSAFGTRDSKDFPDDVASAITEAAWDCVGRRLWITDWSGWRVEIIGGDGRNAQEPFPPEVVHAQLLIKVKWLLRRLFKQP